MPKGKADKDDYYVLMLSIKNIKNDVFKIRITKLFK